MKKSIIVLLVLAAFAVMSCDAPQYFKDGEYTSPNSTTTNTSDTKVDGSQDTNRSTSSTETMRDMSATLTKAEDRDESAEAEITWTHEASFTTGNPSITTTVTTKKTLDGKWAAVETTLLFTGELITVTTKVDENAGNTTKTVITEKEGYIDMYALITSAKTFEFEGITFTLVN